MSESWWSPVCFLVVACANRQSALARGERRHELADGPGRRTVAAHQRAALRSVLIGLVGGAGAGIDVILMAGLKSICRCRVHR